MGFNKQVKQVALPRYPSTMKLTRQLFAAEAYCLRLSGYFCCSGLQN